MSEQQGAVVELRPMSIGDILDATFRLYKARFVPFLTIALIVYVPYALYTLLVGLAQPTQEDVYAGTAAASQGAVFLSALAGLIWLFVIWPLVQGAMIFNISSTILGEPMSAGASFSRAKGRIVALLGTGILYGLAVFLGLILLVVPGIIFALWFMVYAPVVVLEYQGGVGRLGGQGNSSRETWGRASASLWCSVFSRGLSSLGRSSFSG